MNQIRFPGIVLFVLILFSSGFSFSQNDMSFTIVYNNMPSENNLRCDWGYAAWIEMKDEVILFDTGTKPAILQQNFKMLNLDPEKISLVAISHDHYDHVGGLESVLPKLKKNTKVYLPNNFDKSLEGKYPDLKFVVNHKYRKISKNIWVTEVFKNYGNNISEQALVIEKGDRIIIITGCAHPGIIDMCESAKSNFPNKKLELVTGGFHMGGTEAKEVVQISNKLKELGFDKVAPSHCTGNNSIAIFKEAWKEDFVQLNLGDTYFF